MVSALLVQALLSAQSQSMVQLKPWVGAWRERYWHPSTCLGESGSGEGRYTIAE